MRYYLVNYLQISHDGYIWSGYNPMLANNMSGMKKLAAHDFEDILQVCVECSSIYDTPQNIMSSVPFPAFKGLFHEPHTSVIHQLLFTLASWHSLVKLRMHIDATSDHLEDLTAQLGKAIQQFSSVTCTAFVTHELPHETAACCIAVKSSVL
jgi:hypothetical protein